MERQEMIDRLLGETAGAFDEAEAMVVRDYRHWVGGYHTRRTGRTHVIRDTADYAAGVLMLGREADYDRAVKGLYRICELQDVREGSGTFGLWPYYLEEDLEHMLAPDYNWSDFIGKDLIGVCLLCREQLPEDLYSRLLTAVRNAMECSIRRNVGEDYTNMSIMGCMTITAAGELLGDERFLEIGKMRLERLYKYTRYNGAFSEYNSSAYVLVAMNEIMRMLAFFRDERCRFIAGELNRYAWEMLASHYNLSIGQLTPPQARAYRDVDNGSLAWTIWQGTGGRYGRLPGEEAFRQGAVSMESLCFPPKCPEELVPLFEEGERFLAGAYYRRNSLRSEDADLTIIREPDSPDLTAYSWKAPGISMGAFGMCDCWGQRRNVMAVWDRERPKYFRLRCIMGDHDFCSGFTWAAQDRNKILGQLGLVTDRGSFHYILDKDKSGCYETDRLYFCFELGGDTGELRIRQEGKDFLVRDRGVKIRLHVEKWFFDGREAEVKLTGDGKAVILMGYEGPVKRLDTKKLGDTWGIFTLTAETGNVEAAEMGCGVVPDEEAVLSSEILKTAALDGAAKKKGAETLIRKTEMDALAFSDEEIGCAGVRDRITGTNEASVADEEAAAGSGEVSKTAALSGSVQKEGAEVELVRLPGGRIRTKWDSMELEGFCYPVPYRRAIGLDQPDRDRMAGYVEAILSRMQGMEADGAVKENCPISIISMDAWEWPQGVALFAMYQYYRESGDKSVLEYLQDWFDRQMEKGLPTQNINTTCPMLTMACLYEETGEEKYLPLLTEWLDGVLNRLPRTEEGGLQHVVSGILNPGQLWDDTLYMTVLFLARMGRILGDERCIQESIRQFMVHIKYLSDVDSGLFFHGWTFRGRHHFAGALWGRGNSWYTAGLVDYLECLEGNQGVREFLLSTLRQQAQALERLQDESGLWHTLLDDPESYLETSASCAFAYGILKAVRKGYLPGRFAAVGERAVAGVLEKIREDGTVEGVSYGTPVFETLQEYREVEVCPMPYGQSMALMMLVEACRE